MNKSWKKQKRGSKSGKQQTSMELNKEVPLPSVGDVKDPVSLTPTEKHSEFHAASEPNQGKTGAIPKKPTGFWVSFDEFDTTDESDSDSFAVTEKSFDTASKNPLTQVEADGCVQSQGLSLASHSKLELAPGTQRGTDRILFTSDGHLKQLRSAESAVQAECDKLKEKIGQIELVISGILCKMAVKDYRKESDADLTKQLAGLKAEREKSLKSLEAYQEQKIELGGRKMKIIIANNMASIGKKLGVFRSEHLVDEKRRADMTEHESLKRKLADMEEQLRDQEVRLTKQGKKQELEKKNLNKQLIASLNEGKEIKKDLKAAKNKLQETQQSVAQLKNILAKSTEHNAQLQAEGLMRLREEREYLRRMDAAGIPRAPRLEEFAEEMENLRVKYAEMSSALRETQEQLNLHKLEYCSPPSQPMPIVLQVSAIGVMLFLAIQTVIFFKLIPN